MFGGLITSIMIIADAHLHGVASAPAWLAGDSLGGAIFMLLWTACIFLAVAAGGAFTGRAARTLILNQAMR